MTPKKQPKKQAPSKGQGRAGGIESAQKVMGSFMKRYDPQKPQIRVEEEPPIEPQEK